jgi:low temperature requirement protein LtrA
VLTARAEILGLLCGRVSASGQCGARAGVGMHFVQQRGGGERQRARIALQLDSGHHALAGDSVPECWTDGKFRLVATLPPKTMTTPRTLLRHRGSEESARVSTVELFFDLVFVFAVTQLSHTLLKHLTPAGAVQVTLLLLAVWWVWIYTSWATNWLDPERIPVRICLFVLMLAGLLLSSSIPEAFETRGLMFAGAYVFMQVGRTLFFLWATRSTPNLQRTFRGILVWMTLSGIFWIVGAYAHADTRLAWWTLALGLDFLAPWAYFWVPGLGRSTIADWNIEGGHLAERCALFVIIALGESLLVTGATFAEQPLSRVTVAAMIGALIGSVAMWWVYFDTGAERASHRIRHAQDPGRQGRTAYTYLHILIVAGIIVGAVGDELLLAHPDHATDAGVAVILGGPALYLAGNAWFKWVTNDRRGPPLSHIVGLVLLAVLVPFALGHYFSAFALGTLANGALVLVAIWESVALRRPAIARRPVVE